jgi:hypothetical protein
MRTGELRISLMEGIFVILCITGRISDSFSYSISKKFRNEEV